MDGANRDNYITWNEDDKKHDDQDYDAQEKTMLLMPTIVIITWLLQPEISDIPRIFPDKCKISLTNWNNNFTNKSW